MIDLKALSDEQLSHELRRAALWLQRVQGEVVERERAALAKAYGDELPFVDDLYSGTDGVNIVWCFYCGKRPGWQREHKLPKARGGSNLPDNIVRSCMTCNRSKGEMTVEEYRQSLERSLGAAPVRFAGEAAKK